MKIPDSFKTVQKAVFQDKTVTVYSPVEIKGSLNTVTVEPNSEAKSQTLGNFRIIKDELQAKEYGLTVGRDATLTFSEHQNIAVGDFICYQSLFYRVAACIVRDSHDKYFLKRWER